VTLDSKVKRKLFWIKDRLRGKLVRVHYDELKDGMHHSEKGLLIQRKRLDQLLAHFTSNSTYYSECKGKDISEFPVINKSIILSGFDSMVVSPETLPFQQGPIFVQRTSGSTGVPLAVPQDSRKRNRRIAELKYFGEIAGYKSHEKLGQLRIWTKWHGKSKWQSYVENIYPVDCSKMDDDTVAGLCDLVNKKKIKVLWGYAGWFEALADYLKKEPVNLDSLKVIFAGSEMLNERTRADLKHLVNCNVVSRYSSEEQGILGQDTDQKNYQYLLNHVSYYFEILKLDSDEPAPYGELGRIVVTDLYNYAFPMIRYDTGDTGIMLEGNTGTNGFPFLSSLFGRRIDLIYDTKGEAVHPMSLARILKNYNEILQWQFIQKTENSYLLKLNLKNDINMDCLSQLKEIFGCDADIEVEVVDEIPVLASGKRKSVICELRT
jgi:phenylacetate-CoA ligase